MAAKYILAEDFVTALIGPFESDKQVTQHLHFLTQRGDSATVKVIAAPELSDLDVDLQLTPEEDREWEVKEPKSGVK